MECRLASSTDSQWTCQIYIRWEFDDDGKRVVSVFGSLHVPFHRALAVDLCSRLAEWLRTGMVVVSMSIFLRVIGSVTVF